MAKSHAENTYCASIVTVRAEIVAVKDIRRVNREECLGSAATDNGLWVTYGSSLHALDSLHRRHAHDNELVNGWVAVADEKGKNGCVFRCAAINLPPFVLNLLSLFDIGLGQFFQTSHLPGSNPMATCPLHFGLSASNLFTMSACSIARLKALIIPTSACPSLG